MENKSLPRFQDEALRSLRELKPGGCLYTGHSERVAGEATRLLEPVGATIYRRNEA